MIATESPEVQEILNRVKPWPKSQQMRLAQQILAQAATDGSGTRGRPADEVVGMLKVTGTVPSDAACKEVLEDELMRKFSR